MRAGRRSTRPSTVANSFAVTGSGATALTGPVTPSSSTAWAKAPAMSSAPIQLSHGLPSWLSPPEVATGPPSPARNSGSTCCSMPPAGLSTTPVRSIATRIPAASARRASASQSATTSARKSSPGSRSSTRPLPNGPVPASAP